VVLANSTCNYFISEKYKIIPLLSYISFKTAPWCNYTILAATVKVLEIFLEAIL
jgi:hypothetical protein